MIKVFLLTTFLTISSVSFNSFDSKPNVASDYDFEDKIVFNVNNSADTSIDSNSQSNESKLQVIFQYDNDFACNHLTIESENELMEHRQELAEHYQATNLLRLTSIKLDNYDDVYASSYSPFIVFEYDSLDEFIDSDYNKLALSDSHNLSTIYVETIDNTDMASRNTSSSENYPFEDALADIGIPENKEYDGTGVKIGSIESGIPNNYSNLNGVNYETFGTYKTSHAFQTSSIYASNAGIASDASIYFAALTGSNFVECGDWLISKGVNVINRSNGASVGTYNSDSAYADYLVQEAKVTFSISAGNSGNTDAIGAPSTGINVISVASNDVNLSISQFSSAGLQSSAEAVLKKPTLTAPGGAISGVENVSGPISGTSFSAPMVTGIAAILMEEYPELKYQPEAVMSILTNSTTYISGQNYKWDHDAGFGLVNYERAREAAANYDAGILTSSVTTSTPIVTKNITIPTGSSFYFNTNILFNASASSSLSSIDFSKLEASLLSSSGNIVATTSEFSNFSSFIYSNDTLYQNFTLSVKLSENKDDNEYEYYGYSYYVSNEFDAQITLVSPSNEADIAPMIRWQQSTRGAVYPHAPHSIIFFDGNNNEITRIENIDKELDSYVLREDTWQKILSAPGQNYKVVVGYENTYGDIPDYYSAAKTYTKPTTSTLKKTIIYPNQYGFPESYGGNQEEIAKSFDAGGFHFDTLRKRCGYIQSKVINLSPRKEGVGEAFLQYTVDSLIYRADFDLAFWSDSEYFTAPSCKAYIQYLNSDGKWVTSLDILNDITLNEGYDLLETYGASFPEGAYTFRIYAYSPTIGIHNKGRISIGNMTLYTVD